MTGMADQLFTFHGGLKLEGHKKESNQTAIQPLMIPPRLVIPLQQHIGQQPEVIVSKGDRVLKGQMLATPDGAISASVHAPTSGTIIDIADNPVPHPSGMAACCITIETDGKDESVEKNIIGDDFKNRDNEALLEVIRNHGIVGLGGATFPTSEKLRQPDQQHIHTLIINGAECEPYITCDDRLMRERADEIISGCEIIRHLIKPEQIVLAIEDNKPEAIEILRQSINNRSCPDARVVSIPTRYPTGGEKQLIKIITGQEVPSGKLPASIGVLCQNVATAASVHRAIYHDEPLISRVVTVTGAGVTNPGNHDCLIGTPMSFLIEQAGGYKANAKRLIMGGPMMGFTLNSDDLPITKACNCLLVDDHNALPTASACIRCGECVKVCPADLLPQQLYWYASAQNFDRAQDVHLFDCIECGCCSYVCPSHIPLVQYYRFAKTEIWQQEKDKKKSDIARQRHEFHEARIAREKAEREEKLRQKKEMLAKKKNQEGAKTNAPDPKKAAIEAALKRVQAKKEAAGVAPKNTDNLTDAQKQQIEQADARRQSSEKPAAKPDSNKTNKDEGENAS